MAYSDKWREAIRDAIQGIPQAELARKMNMSTGTIQNMLSGRIPAEIKTVQKFADAIGDSRMKWELFAKICKTDVHMREYYDMSEESMRQVLDIVEELERKEQNK